MSDDDSLILTVRTSHSGEDLDTQIVAFFSKQPGDWVQRGDPVVELEGSKVTIEVTSPADGVIVSTVAPRTEVKIGDPLYTLRLSAPGRGPSAGPGALGTPAGVVALSWGGEPAERPFLERKAPYRESWGLCGILGASLVSALLSSPALVRSALGGTDRVALRLGLVAPGLERWWHMALWPGAWAKDALTELREGPGPEAWVTVIALSGFGLEFPPPPRGLALLLRPPPGGPPAGPWGQAQLQLTLDGAPLPEHETPFLAALIEQLQAKIF